MVVLAAGVGRAAVVSLAAAVPIAAGVALAAVVILATGVGLAAVVVLAASVGLAAVVVLAAGVGLAAVVVLAGVAVTGSTNQAGGDPRLEFFAFERQQHGSLLYIPVRASERLSAPVPISSCQRSPPLWPSSPWWKCRTSPSDHHE